jgi:hypothetical protein
MSQNSGEEFYHNLLNKSFYEAYISNSKLIIDLDNTAGYPPSFIDESIGNLVYDFGLNNVKNVLDIISAQEPNWIEYINTHTFPLWEQRRVNGQTPVKTAQHDPWYILDKNNNIMLNDGYTM